MENNKINVADGKPCSFSDVEVNLSEEKSLPSGDHGINPEKVELNVNTELKVASSSAQDTPRQVEIESIIPDEDEDVITLSAISADEEAFEDLIEECPETEESELPVKIEHKLETYFSDIESSDNSQEYEPVFEMKVKEKVDLEVKRDAVNSGGSTENVGVECSKTEIELELEPVESDEEDFEDLLTLKKAPVLGNIDENLSDISTLCDTDVEAAAALPQETDKGDVIQSAAVGEEPKSAPKKLEEANEKDVVVDPTLENLVEVGEPAKDKCHSDEEQVSVTSPASPTLKADTPLNAENDSNSTRDNNEVLEDLQDKQEKENDDKVLAGSSSVQDTNSLIDEEESMECIEEDIVDCVEEEIMAEEVAEDTPEPMDIDDANLLGEEEDVIQADEPKDLSAEDQVGEKETQNEVESCDDVEVLVILKEEEMEDAELQEENPDILGKEQTTNVVEAAIDDGSQSKAANESFEITEEDRESTAPKASTESDKETLECKEDSPATNSVDDQPFNESPEEKETIESKNESEISIADDKATKSPDSEKSEQQIDGEVDQIPKKSVESVEETSISSLDVQISPKDEEDTKPAETVDQVIEPQPSPNQDDQQLEKVEESMEATVAPAESPNLESSTEKPSENEAETPKVAEAVENICEIVDVSETKETTITVEETKQSDLPVDDVLTVSKTTEEKIEDKSGSNSDPPASMTIDTKVAGTQQEAERRQSTEQKVDESKSTVQSSTQPPEESISEKPTKSPDTQKVESSDQEEPSKPAQSEEPPQMEDNELEMESPPSPKDIEMLDTAVSTEESIFTKEQPAVEKGMPTEKDDEEPLLMIDTSHKEENDQEDNDMDTDPEQTATSTHSTDSSSEGSLEVFYDKECIHYECKHGSKNFFRATLFTLNYYKISKKRNKAQFVCEDCYDRALGCYEDFCKALKQKQPLLRGTTFKGQEFVEIIDSSDEEDTDGGTEKYKDENALPRESITLLEAELEGAIRKVMNNVEIQNQLSWTKQILQQRLKTLEEDTEYVSVHLKQLQKKADNMHNSLYQCPKIKIRQLTPLDLNSGRTYNPENETSIPPMGEILRQSIRVNETYYAVKNKAIASWVPCKVIEETDSYLPSQKNLKHFKIKFLKSKYPMLKTVSAKHMAFFNPPKVRLPIGTRVIAYFDASSLSRGKEKMLIPSAFYPGIIAEPLKQSNKFRYLVFYDDGYFQYVYHKDVRLVCHSSENVWEDVHHQSRDFIHNYLTQYAVNRPMVQTQKGQSMLVDYNGKWIYARVIDVDCSLVQMLFEGHSRSEWIYRGSTRLGPVYKESNNLVQKSGAVSRLSRRTEPFIRYSNGDENASQNTQDAQQQQGKPGEVRSVAKKSVSRSDSQSSQPTPTVRHLNNSTIFVDDDNKPKGKVVYYTARKNMPPRNYFSHLCNPSCPFTVTHNLSLYSPLAKPLLSGWERQVLRQKSKKFIIYRGPCGKRMRNMDELHKYLRITRNELNVDNFDFSPETNCLAEYVIESCIVQKKDISNGKEKMPIPCVNYYDNTMPPDCIYSSRRIPTEGVPLNLDKGFLVGCDCKDDCSDKANCSCWQLTYAGAKYGMPNVPNEMVGYQYKRLYEHVPTGIYECNSRCKCKANCVNRVVQQPLQSKLQVFKTSNRGWGLRCINDVPRGSFICVYAGHLLTEQKANEGGLDAGDEYFAELDYIEVAEQIKEGYESDVPDYEEDEELYNPDKDDDDDEFVAPGDSRPNRAIDTRLRTRRSTKDAEHDSQERQVISFEPNKTMGQPDNSASEKPTIRKLFGKDEACYIMDAKVTGNLGRYFNHSCSPNLFVQNVFVDTHDLRFPWVAFFAFTHIRAGTELTWNYNYEVGVVPGKVLYCQCGAPNCRQRLL